MTARYLIMLATTLMLSLSAAAQHKPGTMAGKNGEMAGSAGEISRRSINADQNHRLNVSFKGGTVADYIDALRKADPQVNIVEMGDLSVFDMPAVQLKNVSLHQAMDVLDNIRTQRGATLHMLDINKHEGANPVYSIHTESRITDDPAAGKLYSRVWFVGRILQSEDINEDALLSAIEAAANLSPGLAESTRINFHQETNLILARGPIQSIEAIEDVIDQLWSAGPERENEIEQLLRENEALREELEHLRHEREQAQQELRDVHRHRAELEAEVRALSMQNEELQHKRRATEQELMEMRQHVQQLEIELARQTEAKRSAPDEKQ